MTMARLLPFSATHPSCLLLVLALLGALRGSDDASSPSDDVDSSTSVNEDDEQFEKRAEIEMGWSVWSEWSTCSRTCDGGASHQLRRCNARQGCRGEGIRYRICSMQPCPEQTEFRGQQCSAYDAVPYQDEFYEWEPHHDSQDPCALTCRTKGHNIVTQLAPKVLDGTRCREGSLDMCINGKCQPVGCDLQLGSTKKVDACGVCGGDGASCAKPSFYWEETAVSECSATCGGGTQLVKPVCKNKKSGEEVDERLCDLSKRPPSRTRECKADKCPASWLTEDWSSCSASCDGGWQERRVSCVEIIANGTSYHVEEGRCSRRKPKSKQSCNTEPCPKWFELPWSPCSVTCGQGYQTRNVICRDAKGHVNKTCDSRTKPQSTQSCTAGVACHKPIPDTREHAAPIVQPYPPPQAQRYTGTHIVTSEPSFVPDSWGQCSVTCGTGVRRRKVDCKIFLEFSRTIAKLPDKECPGNKPLEVERCAMRPCAMNQMDSANHIEDTRPKLSYSWRQTGFTPCSASCLGGVRESIIQCSRDHDQAVVSPYLCDISKKPDVITQTCNDQPCPPRWNVSEFSACSKPCGSGLQTRQVHCVHEVTRGGNTLVVPNSVCTQPPPRAQQFCNVVDCPPRWEPSVWSKCSKACNKGVKTRKLQCQQVVALGYKVDKSPSHCPNTKPVVNRACNTHPCVEKEAPKIYSNSNTYTQKENRRRVSLKVGGKAILFRGTHLTVKCPVGKFNRSRIRWTKDKDNINSSGRTRVSRNGALRIRSIQESDNGVYTCIAGRSKSNITLRIKNSVRWTDSNEGMSVDPPPNSLDTNLRPGINKMKPNSKRPPGGKPKPDDRYQVNPPEQFPWSPNPRPNPESTSTRLQSPKMKPLTIEDENTIEIPDVQTDLWPKKPPMVENTPGLGNALSDQRRESDPTKPSDDKGGFYREMPHADKMPNPRAMPHIQQLLTNIKNTLGSAHSSRLPTTADGLDYEGMGDHPSSFVLGKGKAENLEFDWMVTNWSTCSQQCGVEAYQVRASQCVVRLHNVSKTVDHSLCVDAGMQPPATRQPCGLKECPHWHTGYWAECVESRCTSLDTATQRRLIRCRLKNGTAVDESLCNAKTKPRQRRKCYNDKCRGSWRTGEWSKCTIACGDSGFQSRLVQCVWFGTKKIAKSACRDKPRPINVRPCRGPPCPRTSK